MTSGQHELTVLLVASRSGIFQVPERTRSGAISPGRDHFGVDRSEHCVDRLAQLLDVDHVCGGTTAARVPLVGARGGRSGVLPRLLFVVAAILLTAVGCATPAPELAEPTTEIRHDLVSCA